MTEITLQRTRVYDVLFYYLSIKFEELTAEEIKDCVESGIIQAEDIAKELLAERGIFVND